ncbi:polysaccharide deacetylase family protein [Wolbachia endosymbiont of Mansonella perstans]|uniref:polysaccharide deacetylase family protein n=1 Tax=Wolbachia endosymbiont of Mansonella perstans TaxID=229526 RepID=UPI001CE18160
MVNNSGKFVAPTFDNETSNSRVNNIINVLKSYKAKATFFLLGEHINKKTSEIAKRIYNAGHELGNHS